MYSCSFTGHRLSEEKPDRDALERILVNLINQGVKNFFSGMAMGFDLLAAETVLKLKEKYKDIRLIACIPFEGQSKYYGKDSLALYERVLQGCDEKIVFSPNFYNGCMHKRNRFLVDNCDVLISFLRKQSGGTFYTVSYARSLGKKIIEL